MVVPLLLLLFQATLSGHNSASVANVHARAQDTSRTFAERRQAYEQLLQHGRANASLYADYVSLLLANRAYEPALSWSEKGLATSPSDGTLRLRKGIALHALGRPEESVRTLEGLPALSEARFYMGLNYRILRDHASAQRCLAEAWELGFRDPYALYALIEEDHALGDKAAGLRHFQAFATQFPDSPWLHVLYANAYFLKDREEDARKEYLEALRKDPQLPGVNFRLGYVIYRNGEYPLAAEFFSKELAVNPAYSDASLFLGETLRQQGRGAEAAGHLRRAIALDARSELAYRSLAAVLQDQGELNDAVDVLIAAERQFPSDPSFPGQLARILTTLKRGDEALREEEKFHSLTEAQRAKERSEQKQP